MEQIDSTAAAAAGGGTADGGGGGGFAPPGLHGAIWGQLALLEFLFDANQGPVVLVLLLLLLRLELVTVIVVVPAFVHGCCFASTSQGLLDEEGCDATAVSPSKVLPPSLFSSARPHGKGTHTPC